MYVYESSKPPFPRCVFGVEAQPLLILCVHALFELCGELQMLLKWLHVCHSPSSHLYYWLFYFFLFFIFTCISLSEYYYM